MCSMSEYERYDREMIEARHRLDLAQYPAEPSLLIDRLVREHHKAREGHIGLAPVSVASMQLKSQGSCWQTALNVLRTNYDEETTREVWWWLMADPAHGWATWNEDAQRWLPYCVPGYSPLCGDAVSAHCLPAARSLLPAGRGKSPLGRLGRIEVWGRERSRYTEGHYITTGLIDRSDPQHRVYHLEEAPCSRAAPGTVLRVATVPQGEYYLGIDLYTADGAQAYLGSFEIQVRPGQTVEIRPNPRTQLLEVAPIRSAGLIESPARRRTIGYAMAGTAAALFVAGAAVLWSAREGGI